MPKAPHLVSASGSLGGAELFPTITSCTKEQNHFWMMWERHIAHNAKILLKVNAASISSAQFENALFALIRDPSELRRKKLGTTFVIYDWLMLL